LIAVVIVLAICNPALKVLLSTLSTRLDPTEYSGVQTLFGMIFTVIIALESKRSLLMLAAGVDSAVQVRAVLLIALLAVVRKLSSSTSRRPREVDLHGLSLELRPMRSCRARHVHDRRQ
jgi:uncharacterized membrane protein (DUF373 family)